MKNKLFGSVKKTARTYAPAQYIRLALGWFMSLLVISGNNVVANLSLRFEQLTTKMYGDMEAMYHSLLTTELDRC
jgi:hypothetical protein